MEELIQRCAGIDVGQAESVVCVRVPDTVTGAPAELIATYARPPPTCSNWSTGCVVWVSPTWPWSPPACTGNPSTTCWRTTSRCCWSTPPTSNTYPVAKTDTIDAAWIAQLLAHGLLTASFVPPPRVRELRDLTRYRKALINEKTAQINRIHKVLQDAGFS